MQSMVAERYQHDCEGSTHGGSQDDHNETLAPDAAKYDCSWPQVPELSSLVCWCIMTIDHLIVMVIQRRWDVV
jgi:hypothetical protein